MPTGHQGDDRRKKPRIPRRLPVRFGTDARMCGGTAVDISEGGLRIETGDSFPVNSVVLVFVQFPRHSVRLRARVAWTGGQGGSPLMGLSFTQPEPTLARAYKEWQAEVKLAAQEAGDAGPAAAGPNAPAASPEAGALAAPAPPSSAPEPQGPLRRRLETRQGNAYDVLLEKQGGWRVTIIQVPRQIGVDAPDFEGRFPDYAAAERALRDFLKTH